MKKSFTFFLIFFLITEFAFPQHLTTIQLWTKTSAYQLQTKTGNNAFGKIEVDRNKLGVDRPLARCKDIRRYITETEIVSISPVDINNGSSTVHGIDTMYLDVTNFSCEDMGKNEVTLTVKDTLGNVENCIANVEILPSNKTVSICVDDVTDFCEELDLYEVRIVKLPVHGTLSFLGSCAIYMPHEGFNGIEEIHFVSVSTNDVRDTTVVFIEVIDRPLARCKDIRRYITKTEIVSISPADINNGSSAVHGIDTMYLDVTDFSCEDMGKNEVTLTVKDTLGNMGSCMAIVEILPKRDTIYRSIPSNETVSVCVDDVTDFCEELDLYEVRIVKLPVHGTLSFLGSCAIYMPHEGFNGIEEIHFVSVSTNDVRDTTVVFIEVIDRPLARCKDIRRYITKTEIVSISPADINNGSSAVHGIDTMYLDVTDFSCEDMGKNEVTLTVKDTLGNMGSCMAIVEILPKRDTIYRSIPSNETVSVCVDDVTDFCEELDLYEVRIVKLPVHGTLSFLGSCAIYMPHEGFNGIEEIHFVSVSTNDVRDTTVVFIEVIDRPLARCKDIRRYITKTEIVSISPADINNGSSAVHGIDTMYLDVTDFSCEDMGKNEVTLTVKDTLGNMGSCMAIVEILPKRDTIYRSIPSNETVSVCVDDVTDFCEELDLYEVRIVKLPVHGTLSFLGSCAIYMPHEGFNGIEEIHFVSVSTNDVRDTTVVFIEVIDRPLARCKDIRRYITKTEIVSISPADINNGSSAVHGIDTMYLDVTDFSCEDMGKNEVTLTVKDTLGNMGSCMAIVEILPKRDTIYRSIPSNETVSVCVDDVTDFCEELDLYEVRIVKLPVHGTLSFLGSCAIYMPHEGFNGIEEIHFVSVSTNDVRDTTVVFIEVIDRPLARCKDIRRYITKTESVSISPADINNGSSAVHGIDTMYLDVTDFSCEDMGKNEVTLTVKDTLGNMGSCMAIVEILPKRDTIYRSIPSNETVSVCVDDVTDFCEELDLYEVRIVKLPVHGTLSFLGSCAIYMPHEGFNGIEEIHFVSVSTNDVRDTTVVFIEVIDRPLARCKDIRRYITKTEIVSISPADINNGSSAVHGIDTMYLDVTDFSCEDMGKNEVTLTVKDTLGNVGSCMAIVEILPKRDTIYRSIPSNETVSVCVDDVTDFCEELDLYEVRIVKLPVHGTLSFLGSCAIYMPHEGFNGIDEIHFVSVSTNDVRDTTVVFIEVIDRPLARCKDIRRYITKTEIVSISPADINNGSSDIHGIDTMYLDVTDFSCEDMGKNEVTLTVKDTLGNVESCMAIVEILPKRDTIFQSIKSNEIAVIFVEEKIDFCEELYSIRVIKPPSNGAIKFVSFNAFYMPNKEFTEGKDEIHFVSVSTNSVRDTLVVIIEVECDDDISNMFIPQLLTPNGDGANDRWKIPYLKYGSLCYSENKVVIFNSIGQVIFNEKNYGKDSEYWDGYYKEKRVPDGIYYYYIIIDGDKDNVRTGFIYVQW